MKYSTVALILVLLFSSLSFSQQLTVPKEDPVKFGVQFSPLLPADEFPSTSRNIKTAWLGRALLRFGVSESMNMEVGAGYGQYAGLGTQYDYYKTEIYPVDLRLQLKLVQEESFPYLFVGLGGMYYDLKFFPELSPSPKEVDDKGFTAFAPIGIGYQLALGKAVAADFSLGATFTTTDNLNYYKQGNPWDAYYHVGIGLLFGGAGAKDSDMDGLLDEQEEILGTDPMNPDTDGDGLKDGEEVNKTNTDPLKADTDNDGLKDGAELNSHMTDPLKADTDGDDLKDGDEVNQYKTNPLKVDTDGDTLSDGAEVLQHKTSPVSVDTDKDSLKDNEELNQYKTNPLKPDTDNDGLKDNEEVLTYKSNPNNVDTDGGTIQDGAEVKRGTDPLNADDDVMKVGQAIILKGINFETNSANITPESEETLQKALQTLQNNPDVLVEISGHTDNVGSNKSNQKLSLRRAESVKKWLVEKGIEASRLSTKGYGEEKPVASNDTADGKLQNRRIEFVRTK